MKRVGLSAALVVLLLVVAVWPTRAVAAERQFVGVLALAVENDVAGQLQLTGQQKRDLLQLIDSREEEVLELVLQLRDLPPPEQAAKLAPFRAESEARGRAILSPEQWQKLQQIRIRRQGLQSLVEPEVAEQLKLTAEQRTRAAALLQKREADLAQADENAARVIRADAERDLSAVLSDRQRAQWEALAGARMPTPAPPPEAAPPPAAARPPGETAEPKQQTETPPLNAPPEEAAEAAPDTSSQSPQTSAELPDGPPTTPGKLRFNFRFQPWKDVLDWFARQADLSLVLDAPPPGTLNYTDDRQYTPDEAIDVLNRVLVTKGYTLIRLHRMLILVNLKDEIPSDLLPTIRPQQLDDKGEYELLTVLFDLDKNRPEDIEEEVRKLVGSRGSVAALPKSRQLLVTGTGGRLRAVRAMIERIEDPEGLRDTELRTVDLQYATGDEVLSIVRQLFDIPEDGNATSDGSLRFALDPTGTRLLVTGKPEMLEKLDKVRQAVDVLGPGQFDTMAQTREMPQFEVYSITTADSESVLSVMQTLMAGHSHVRLSIDPKTGNLAALAYPSEHATIRATLDQMQQDSSEVEVIQLYSVDPQLAVLSINKLFGATDEKEKGRAPIVDADPISRQLLIRGTKSQIAQIRSLLEKMGETSTAGGRGQGAGNVRMIPLTGSGATAVLERIRQLWPAMRQNEIRIVTPSAISPTMREYGSDEEPELGRRTMRRRLPGPRMPISTSPGLLQPTPTPEARPTRPDSREPGRMPRGGPWERRPRGSDRGRPSPMTSPRPVENRAPADRSAEATRGPRVIFVSQTVETPAEESQPQPDSSQPTAAPLPQEPPVGEPQPVEAEPTEPDGSAAPPASAGQSNEPAPIIVAPTPGGLMIASQDLEALADFEALLNTLAGDMTSRGSDMTIFYLKYVKASAAAETLDQIFGGGTVATTSESGRSGGLIGDLASAALGGGGGIMGALLGAGGSSETIAPTGSIRIIPYEWHNALIVQANPADTETIDRLLEVLDQQESPEEVLAVAKARLVPVINTRAEEVADVVQQVYRDRMVTGSGERGRPPSPEDFVRMLRGGGRGSRGSNRSSSEEAQKLSIGVDARSNSVIVAAPEPLFQEVQQLIMDLDAAAIGSNNETMRVVTLRNSSPEAVQKALQSMMGDSVQVGRSGSSSRRGSSTGGRPPSSGQPSMDARRAMFFEMMRRARESGGRGGPPGGFRGRQGGGGPPGGGRGR